MANSEHSEFFELAKGKYDSGKWNARMIKKLVDAGKLTQEEYREITGKEYAA